MKKTLPPGASFLDQSFCRDQVVVDRLAAGDEVDFGVGGVLLEQSQGLFGVGFGESFGAG